MSYIIVTRNPNNKRLIVMSHENDSAVEFASRDEADRVARGSAAFSAWGYEIVEIEQP